MATTESPETHPAEHPSSHSNGSDAPPDTEDDGFPLRRGPRQAAQRLSMLGEGMPEVGMDGYREIMDAVGSLAGRVAHHLNNLLTVVDANAAYVEETLGDRGLASELREIREIRNACGRASDLTTRLLAISGYRWGEPRIVDLRTLVSDMDLGHFFAHDVAFCTDFAAVTCPVRVDPAHLEEVVFELVLNAREAVGGRGTVRVGIDHFPRMKVGDSAANGWVRLEVSDSGQGMDEETLARVFHPFFSTHPFSEDRGLGLSVVCGLVRQIGGTMKISSAPGRGTTVRVWLPAAPSAPLSNNGPGPNADPES